MRIKLMGRREGDPGGEGTRGQGGSAPQQGPVGGRGGREGGRETAGEALHWEEEAGPQGGSPRFQGRAAGSSHFSSLGKPMTPLHMNGARVWITEKDAWLWNHPPLFTLWGVGWGYFHFPNNLANIKIIIIFNNI